MGKRIKNQNHTCTIHRNTTNSSISLGSNIQFSTNTEKEQEIITKTCNNASRQGMEGQLSFSFP
jgi:hypothetical protein